MTRYFTPELFKFLTELKDNNERAWFKANQDRYEDAVRQPALDFITDHGPLRGQLQAGGAVHAVPVRRRRG